MAVTDLGQVFFVHEHSTNPPPKTNMIWIRPIDVMLGTYDFYRWNGTTWILFEPTVGGVFRGVWNNLVTYKRYDIVRYGQTLYSANQDNLNKQPDSNLVEWELVLAASGGGGITIPELQIQLLNVGDNTRLSNQIKIYWTPQENTEFLFYTPQIWLFRHKSKTRSKKKYNGVYSKKKISTRFSHPENNSNGLIKLAGGTEFPLPLFPYTKEATNNDSLKFTLDLNYLEWFRYDISKDLYSVLGQPNRPRGVVSSPRNSEYIAFAVVITLRNGNKVIGPMSKTLKYQYQKTPLLEHKFSLAFA
jgi:hypothetical protein